MLGSNLLSSTGSLDKDCPEPQPVQPRPPGETEVTAFPRVCGIHHCCEWKQAA